MILSSLSGASHGVMVRERGGVFHGFLSIALIGAAALAVHPAAADPVPVNETTGITGKVFYEEIGDLPPSEQGWIPVRDTAEEMERKEARQNKFINDSYNDAVGDIPIPRSVLPFVPSSPSP